MQICSWTLKATTTTARKTAKACNYNTVIRVKREKDATDTLALAETAASTTLQAASLASGTVGDNSVSRAEETHSNESEVWLVGDNGRLVKLVDINTRLNFTEHNR